jgi:hypothetical protein
MPNIDVANNLVVERAWHPNVCGAQLVRSLHHEFSAHSQRHTDMVDWAAKQSRNRHMIFPKETSSHQPLGMSICQHCVDMGAAHSAGMTVTGYAFPVTFVK